MHYSLAKINKYYRSARVYSRCCAEKINFTLLNSRAYNLSYLCHDASNRASNTVSLTSVGTPPEIKKIKTEEIEIEEGKIEESDIDTGEVGPNEVEESDHLLDCNKRRQLPLFFT